MDRLAPSGSALSDKPDTLSGLRFSAGLLIALGGFLAIYVPFYLFILCVLLFRRLRSHSMPPDQHLTSVVLTIFGAAALSYLCSRSGIALKHARDDGQRTLQEVGGSCSSISGAGS
jgi:hypothetical protein